jgi:hypothetical protein
MSENNLLQRSVTTVGCQESGNDDEDQPEDDVDHPAVAPEPACPGCR